MPDSILVWMASSSSLCLRLPLRLPSEEETSSDSPLLRFRAAVCGTAPSFSLCCHPPYRGGCDPFNDGLLSSAPSAHTCGLPAFLRANRFSSLRGFFSVILALCRFELHRPWHSLLRLKSPLEGPRPSGHQTRVIEFDYLTSHFLWFSLRPPLIGCLSFKVL